MHGIALTAGPCMSPIEVVTSGIRLLGDISSVCLLTSTVPPSPFPELGKEEGQKEKMQREGEC